MKLSPYRLACLALLCSALCSALSAGDATGAWIRIDHQQVELVDGFSSSALERARHLRTALARGANDSFIDSGLLALARVQPDRFALRMSSSPFRSWYGEGGGLGTYACGTGHDIGSRIAGMLDQIDRRNLVGVLDLVMVQPGPGDLPSGTRLAAPLVSEGGDERGSVGMEIHITHSEVRIDRVETVRQPGGRGSYPIQTPSGHTDAIHTRVGVPVTIPGPPQTIETSPRHLQRAISDYKAGIEALRRRLPQARIVVATMPFYRAENQQRAVFNDAMRAWAAAQGLPLFDLEDLLEVDAEGRPSPHCPAWHEAIGDRLNAAGRERLARAWWALLVRCAANP